MGPLWRRWRRRRPLRLRVPPIRLPLGRRLLLLSVALAAAFWVQRTAVPPLMAYAEQQVHARTVAAIDRAVQGQLASGLRYDDLVVVHRDAQGRVTLVQVDTVRVALLASALQRAVQEELDRLEQVPVTVPLGVLLGSELLAAHGPRIHAAVIPVGAAAVRLEHRFESAGINQARLVVYGLIEARLRVVVPLHRRETVVRADVPLADTVIVGEVPQAWLNLPQPLWPAR